VVVAALLRRNAAYRRVLAAGLVSMTGDWPTVGPALVLMVLLGVPAAVAVAGRTTIMQTLAADRLRGRVFGALGAAQAVSVLVGIGAAS
jgi:hypothetical protein